MTEQFMLWASKAMVYAGALLLSVGVLWRANSERIAAYFRARLAAQAEGQVAEEELPLEPEPEARPSSLSLTEGSGEQWLQETAARALAEAPPALRFEGPGEGESRLAPAEEPAAEELPEPAHRVVRVALCDLSGLVDSETSPQAFAQLCPHAAWVELPAHLPADADLEAIGTWPRATRLHFLDAARAPLSVGGRAASLDLGLPEPQVVGSLSSGPAGWSFQAEQAGARLGERELEPGVPHLLEPGATLVLAERRLRLLRGAALLELARVHPGSPRWPQRGLLLRDLLEVQWALASERGPFLLASAAGSLGAAPAPDETGLWTPPASLGAEVLALEPARTWVFDLSPAGPQGLRLGRGPSCELRAPWPSVSREHARLLVRGEEVHVSDLGSTRGSWVGREELGPGLLGHLRSGEPLRLGELLCFTLTRAEFLDLLGELLPHAGAEPTPAGEEAR